MVSNLILAFIGGLVIGAVLIFFYFRKLYIRVQTKHPEIDVTRETITAIMQGEVPKGEIIINNPVTEYVKEHEGEIKLGDILEDDHN